MTRELGLIKFQEASREYEPDMVLSCLWRDNVQALSSSSKFTENSSNMALKKILLRLNSFNIVWLRI